VADQRHELTAVHLEVEAVDDRERPGAGRERLLDAEELDVAPCGVLARGLDVRTRRIFFSG
jgi:hypothetical protein